ncbi:hypothetical protein AKJ36_01810 [candidate division MSBL1 archaeon SCGC-AAA259I07]|uniref:Uncharacterized protein n=1 Tax=candidate division MSBL1 archaeon SCGC-AAA259I07 TaxID=1698266 RepID=A0A133ULF2_9EURY|nr:hypothetical protein AKJ36_01810 [candidate division MSBL1 archaeon SCGC-AAA259I07]
MLKKISELVGEEISDRVSKKFEDLEEALEHLYWWEEGFSVEETGEALLWKTWDRKSRISREDCFQGRKIFHL